MEMMFACKAAKMTPEEIGRIISSATASEKKSVHNSHTRGTFAAKGERTSKPATGGAGTGSTRSARVPVNSDQEKIKEEIKGIFKKAKNVSELAKLTTGDDGDSRVNILHIKKWEEARKPLNVVLCLERKFIDKLKKKLDVDPLMIIFTLNDELKEHIEGHTEEVLEDLKSNWTDAYPTSVIESATGFKLMRNSRAHGFDISLVQ